MLILTRKSALPRFPDISMAYVERLESEDHVGHHHHYPLDQGKGIQSGLPLRVDGLPRNGGRRPDGSEPSTLTTIPSDTTVSERTPLLVQAGLTNSGHTQAPHRIVMTYRTNSRSKLAYRYASIIKLPNDTIFVPLEDSDRSDEWSSNRNHTEVDGMADAEEVTSLRQFVGVIVCIMYSLSSISLSKHLLYSLKDPTNRHHDPLNRDRLNSFSNLRIQIR